MTRKIGILTGGGDVPPLNSVIHSAYGHGELHGIEVVGLGRGWQGLIERETFDIGKLNLDPSIGGTVLRSSRVNLAKVDGAYEKVRDSMSALGLEGLIIVGGEDTLSNAFYLKDIPQILISKTIDNDVGINKPGKLVNYFTLGYPTAAERISSFVSLREGLRTTAYSHERIIVVESMGMHAGWLALSSAMGQPDFVVIPEFPLDYERFAERVKERFLRHRNVIIVVSEGARWADGSHISADESDRDNFGHPKFKGAAEVLAKNLKIDLSKYFDTRNVNSVNPSYLYRSGRPNQLDLESASMLGKKAVDLLSNGLSEPVFLTLGKRIDSFAVDTFRLADLNGIEEFHRFVDKRFYDINGLHITAEGKEYLSHIIKDLGNPYYGLPGKSKENK